MVGRLGERRLGGKGSGAASETGRDPHARFHPKQLQQRGEPTTAVAPDLRETKLEAAHATEKDTLSGAIAAAAKPSAAPARRTLERSLATAGKGTSTRTTDVLQGLFLMFLQDLLPDRRTEPLLGLQRGCLEAVQLAVFGF